MVSEAQESKWEVQVDYVYGERLYFVTKDGSRIGTFDDMERAQEYADALNGKLSD